MTRSGDGEGSSAKERFAELVARHDRGERVDWGAEIAAQPTQGSDLAELLASWRRVEGLLAGLTLEPEMIASAAREALGGDDGLDGFTRETLAQLSDPKRHSIRYSALEVIALGGMGQITRVFDRDLDRELAMKTLRVATGEKAPIDGRATRRFLMEARIAARLEHPGILPVHDIGVDETGRPYFTMPLVRGMSLAQVLELEHERLEGWSLAGVLEVVLKVCDALAYAHEQGVVHRDLKPANILVGRFGETYVMDWGLARASSREIIATEERGEEGAGSLRKSSTTHGPSTAHGAVLGTVHYMAPEQAHGELERIGPHSDVYAIGAILYHAASGRMPFHGASEEYALAALRRGAPRSLALLAPDAPVELISICEKAMARAPEERYRSCAEMALDLRAYMEGRVVAAHEEGSLAELRKWGIRHRFGLGLCGITALIVTIVVVTSRWTDHERRLENELLAEGRALGELLERAPALWPAVPGSRLAFERWIADAERLLARLPEHERELTDLRTNAVADPNGARNRFDDPSTQWQHDTLARLVRQLQVLSGSERKTSALAEARAGLEFARSVERRSLVDAAGEWARTIQSIASSPKYAGLRIPPQLGLVPLGADPESGLYEFADLASGDPAQRDATGKLVLTARSGVVLVLVPSTRFRMGSIPLGTPSIARTTGEAGLEVDPLAREDETPSIAIELDAYFLARHELTRAQWRRIAPVTSHVVDDSAANPLLPIDTVSWHEARAVIARVEFVLPTEAQWECAVRAGGSTRYWCGPEVECLTGRVQASQLPDGSSLHATKHAVSVPVVDGSPNPWGFIHITGNVAEWVEDAHVPTLAGARRPGDALAVSMDSNARVVRGGSYVSAPADLRCAARRALSPETRSVEVGLRPARVLRR